MLCLKLPLAQEGQDQVRRAAGWKQTAVETVCVRPRRHARWARRALVGQELARPVFEKSAARPLFQLDAARPELSHLASRPVESQIARPVFVLRVDKDHNPQKCLPNTLSGGGVRSGNITLKGVVLL